MELWFQGAIESCLLHVHFLFTMQIDLSQYIESAEIILFQKKQGVTITSLCNLLDVTPNTSKL